MTGTAEPIVMDLKRAPNVHSATQAKGEALRAALAAQRRERDWPLSNWTLCRCHTVVWSDGSILR